MRLYNYYVYVLLDQRKPGKYKYGEYEFDYEPFYVGKGHNNRILDHVKVVKRNKFKNSPKNQKIKKILSENFNVIMIKIKENLTENQALKFEIFYIKLIGRLDFKNGPLTNLTDGGEGTRNVIYSKKQRKNQSERMKRLWEDENYKTKQSNSHKDIQQSQETRNKRAESMMGNTNCVGRVPWNKGVKTPKWIRLKLSLAKKGKPSSKKGKKYPRE